ncbi:hypothetical protein ACFLQI_03230 [Candidatus Undinarchaeota archaeon]
MTKVFEHEHKLKDACVLFVDGNKAAEIKKLLEQSEIDFGAVAIYHNMPSDMVDEK